MEDIDLNMEAKEVAGDEANKKGSKKQRRNPKWSIHETMVMLRGKYSHESCETGDKRSGVPMETESGAKVRTKWSLVSAYCRERGVKRAQAECKQRWQNLVVKFRQIWAWEEAVSESGDGESYWKMSRPRRRELKFPGVYNTQIYKFLAKMELAQDDTEAYDLDNVEEVQENGEQENGDTETGSESDNNNVVEEEKRREGEADKVKREGTSAGARLKRKANDPSRASDSDEEMRSADEGGEKQRRFMANHSGGETLRRLINAMENNSNMLKARYEAQIIRCQEEREERNKQSNSLLEVLSNIADAITKIAEKLQDRKHNDKL